MRAATRAVDRAESKRRQETARILTLEGCPSLLPSGEDAEDEVEDIWDDEDPNSPEKRLITYESLFFIADEKMAGSLTLEEANCIFSFLDLDRNAHERAEVLCTVDTAGTGRIVRLAFVELCVELLWNQPLDEIEKAMENYKEAKGMFRQRAREKWKDFGRSIDIYARFLVPMCFFAIIVLLFRVKLVDPYDNADAAQYEGWYTPGISFFSETDVGLCFILPLVMFLIFFFYAGVSLSRAFEPTVQDLRNHAADVARSRDDAWLSSVVNDIVAPPPLKHFNSSASIKCLSNRISEAKQRESLAKKAAAAERRRSSLRASVENKRMHCSVLMRKSVQGRVQAANGLIETRRSHTVDSSEV